ncbi:MAG: hypothetical protein JWR63_2832 [Conexibacter sp.]|nr:hypothetical protein [Conexibacter sp.]
MLSSLRRRLMVAGTAAVLAVGMSGAVGASPASATTIQYHSGYQYIANGYPWVVGPAHSLTNNSAYVLANLCVGAIDVNGGNLTGAGYCSTNYGGTVSHPYCGCVLRDPAVYPYTTAGAVYEAYESY